MISPFELTREEIPARPSRATIVFLLIIAIAGLATGASAQTRTGWATHNDPRGFTMSTPPGWNFSTDVKEGFVAVHGLKGEQVIVWPASVPQPLDSHAAAALARELARQIDPQMSWAAATPANGAVRVSGVAVMTWSR
jgi:hypothetical protein